MQILDIFHAGLFPSRTCHPSEGWDPVFFPNSALRTLESKGFGRIRVRILYLVGQVSPRPDRETHQNGGPPGRCRSTVVRVRPQARHWGQLNVDRPAHANRRPGSRPLPVRSVPGGQGDPVYPMRRTDLGHTRRGRQGQMLQ